MEETEIKTIEAIQEKPVYFKVNTAWPLCLIKKTRTYKIKPLPLSVLFEISKLRNETRMDEQAIKDDPLGESWNMVFQHTKTQAQIVATAITGKYFLSPLLVKRLSRRLLRELTSKQLAKILELIVSMSNLTDFMLSIRLTSTLQTMTTRMRTEDLSPDGHGG